MKSAQEVIDWIYACKPDKNARCLNNLVEILEKFAKPHNSLKTVHIAGTNGKGSTVAYLREAFCQAGYKVATFTSPYIICFGERLSINNIPITDADLIKYANILKNAIDLSTGKYAPFDLITLISFLYFKDANVDIAIYETGIGGRLDATNVITPLATAITNVGHDHAEILGETQLERAMEKLGIVKAGVPLFTTEEAADLLAEFTKVCQAKGADLCLALANAKLIFANAQGTQFSCCGYEKITINMYGKHQFKNATLAVNVLEYLRQHCGFTKLNPLQITKTAWQGRFEHLQKTPPVVLDGAHNLEGVQALIATLGAVYPHHQKRFVFSAIKTKDAQAMLELLGGVAKSIAFTKGINRKAIAPQILAELYDGQLKTVYANYQQAITKELSLLEADEVLVICGSLYFIADARKYLLHKWGDK